MVSVWREYLDESCGELQHQTRKRYYEIQKIEELINTLRSLSGMGCVVTQLNAKKNELEEQQQKMLIMLQALMKISQAYRTAENRIIEQGEACRVRYKYSFQLQNFTMFGEEDIEKKLIRID